MQFGELDTLAARIAAAPAQRPLVRKCGVEIETMSGGVERGRMAGLVRTAGLAHPHRGGHACGYHCNDTTCGEFLVHPSSDGSVTGLEAVVGGPTGTMVTSAALHEAIERLSAILILNGAFCNGSTGGHVHVDRADLSYEDACRLIANGERLGADLLLLMTQEQDAIRNSHGYAVNTSPEQFGLTPQLEARYGPHYAFGSRSLWFWFTAYGTVEFRGWNGTLNPRGILRAIFTSSALVQAAYDGHSVRSHPRVLDFVEPYLPLYLVELVKEHYALKAGETFNADLQEVPIRRQRRGLASAESVAEVLRLIPASLRDAVLSTPSGEYISPSVRHQAMLHI